jgi:hypothetical protein
LIREGEEDAWLSLLEIRPEFMEKYQKRMVEIKNK